MHIVHWVLAIAAIIFVGSCVLGLLSVLKDLYNDREYMALVFIASGVIAIICLIIIGG